MQKVRVTLDLKEPEHKRLVELEALTSAASTAEVLRQALLIYEFVTKRAVEGSKFICEDKAGNRERLLFVPPLLNI